MRQLYYWGIILIAVIFTSCGAGNKFASSFGKRKYTKGYYVDIPSSVKTPVAGNITPGNAPNLLKTSRTLIHTEQLPSVNVSHALTFNETKKLSVKKLYQTVYRQFLPIKDKNEVLTVNAGDDKKTNERKSSGETNFVAIAGFLVSVAGVVLAVIAQTFTVPSIIVLAIGTGLCVYSLFLDKPYFDWLAIIGMSLTIIMLVLIVI